MRDLIELAHSINKDLSPRQRRTELCDLLLEELKTLTGADLEPYLSEFVFDTIMPGTKIVLRFPIGSHIFKC